ncbi:phage antirepressor KilAC domain-containing protein [Methylobacterium sp. J-090]|uniref:phage antirepressor KilAC domain-containing protein n=1 Tax=Methylobacterium sp. J-090 TaxID=2836666 RepID=UPI001FB91204|nr:phage antirepressor KilAC domain-containing protein [Methylobacterium sp. J-090]MCJ2084213.1 phage antirepressor KilAC domain-containing protein [Methylobacterium sp. J-090]
MSALVPITAGIDASGAGFRFDGRAVRIYSRDGEPVFDTRDVARELGYAESSAVTRRLDPDEKGLFPVQTPGGVQEILVVTEPGLYRAIATRRQVASLGVAMADRVARFQRWVFHEVLPSIRKTGRYGAPAAPSAMDVMALFKDPASALEVLGVIGHYARENLALQATVAQQDQALIEKDAVLAVAAPKAEAYDTFLNSEGHYGLQNAARAIGAPPNTFIGWLKADGFLFYQSGSLVPKAPFLKLGVFVVRAAVGDLGAQSFITPYGLTYLSKSWERHLLKTKGPGPGSGSGSPQANLFEAA